MLKNPPSKGIFKPGDRIYCDMLSDFWVTVSILISMESIKNHTSALEVDISFYLENNVIKVRVWTMHLPVTDTEAQFFMCSKSEANIFTPFAFLHC